MKHTKKWLAPLLALIMIFFLAACGAGGEDRPPEQKDSVLVYAALDPLTEERSKLIKRFNNSHEDVQIEVHDYSDENGVQRLLTELVLGQVPDLMEMHRLGEGKDTAWIQTPYEERPEGEYWMPYQQMAQKGYLEDLWPYIENDPDLGREGVLEAPLKAAEVNGGLYMFFSSVSITTMMSPERVAGARSGWTLEEMLETLATMPDGSTVLRWDSDREEIYSMICAPLLDQYIDWETGKAAFDSQGFRNMLGFLETFPDEFKTSLSQEEIDAEIVDRILTGHQLLEAVTVAALWYLPSLDCNFGERAAYIGYPTADGSLGSCFNIHGGPLAMSAACQNKEAAWDFMRQALAKRYSYAGMQELHIQGSTIDIKIPTVLANYRLIKRIALDDSVRENWLTGPLGTKYFKWGLCTEDHEQRFDTLVNNTTQLYWPNDELSNLVWETIGPYFAGDRSLDDTVALVQNRASLYVNENR